jgi:hypothetical protein
MDLAKAQQDVCVEYGVEPDPPNPLDKLGLSKNFSREEYPINGLRHPPDPGTCGWFIWSGEKLSDEPDFFEPLHIVHMEERAPEILPYLALPAGWRFLFAPGHLDIWFDSKLVETDKYAG